MQRVELIEGEVWPAPIALWHGDTTARLLRALPNDLFVVTTSSLPTSGSMPDPDCWVRARDAAAASAVSPRQRERQFRMTSAGCTRAAGGAAPPLPCRRRTPHTLALVPFSGFLATEVVSQPRADRIPQQEEGDERICDSLRRRV